MKRALCVAVSLALITLAACGKKAAETAAPPAPASSGPAVASALPAKNAVKETAYPEHVYWGDEHVHTSYSGDAAAAGTKVDPEQAVRFARGDMIKSNTGKDAQLERALDWVAITDHSDGLGVMSKVQAGDPDLMKDPTVKLWHDMMAAGGDQQYKAAREIITAQAHKQLPKAVMDPKLLGTAWQDEVDVMEKYNDPGKFTAFIAYEWTSNGEVGQNLHRNVIFRDNGDKTRPYPPLTTFQAMVPGRAGTDPESLWKWLADWEAKTGGKVLAIPHNGDLSNGWMFRLARYDGSPMTSDWAAQRARWEPLYEIFQYKGQGETHPALSPSDEFADFEIWDTSDLSGNAKPKGAIQYEYLRQALLHGMQLQDKLGTNPFKYGAVSGTDTHTGLMTGGEEDNWWGKFPDEEPSADRWNVLYKKEQNYTRKAWTLGASGVTGVWATANTRASLWDALKRREVYASSGPRITVRFFGGYDFAAADAQGDLAKVGYGKGVPMGADLKPDTEHKAPTFLFAAMKDPDGGNLDRVQVIKGWVDAKGDAHEKVFDVAWSDNRKPGKDGKVPSVGNTVDLTNATYTNSIGAAQLEGVWKDPGFDPSQKAFYYARVIQIPTPRWTLYDAVKYKVRMDPGVTMVIQERAVSSPIWYTPGQSVQSASVE